MKIFAFNGTKAAYNAFGVLCCVVILYFGFLNNSQIVAVGLETPAITYIAIVIDDFGNGGDGTKEFLYMDIPFTGAVMPNSPYTAEEVRLLGESGKDVILHMPMEAAGGKKSWLPEGSILAGTTPEEAALLCNDALSQLPSAVGINNHMGSKIMEDKDVLKEILTIAAEKDIFFLDSLTTNKSKAEDLAEEIGVTLFLRDVFLDGTKDISKIEKNLKKAADIAEKNGYSIAIGHVGEEGGKATAQAILNMKDELEARGIRFVTMSRLKEILATNTNLKLKQ